MRIVLSLVAAAMMSAAPVLASAQDDGGWRPRDSYGNSDPCAAQQAHATEKGAVTGAVLGAAAGYLLGGRGHKVAGAAVGGAVGATAGGTIAHSNFRCVDYPHGYYAHRHCRWAEENGHGFEICRGRDGVWRPYHD